MSTLVFLAALVAVVSARPNVIDTQNVVNVPPNCPTGQEYINGDCRDVWRQSFDTKNVVTVPANCPSGQQWINGACRDIWRQNVKPTNTVTVPPNCPSGQEYVNGECRDIWRQNEINPTNVVTVPPNCPEGQEYINGECRDVWIKRNEFDAYSEYDELKKLFAIISEAFKTHGIPRLADEAKAILQDRNIISIPIQCPIGQAADALGNCRPTFD